ncbi:MAG: exo-alpha-sialidase [Armatimonadetes bacterium]|nr:exo-alpha-sialidase [Armatimonadota bacterium]
MNGVHLPDEASGTVREATSMKIGTIAPLSYTPGQLEYFQFLRGGVGADYHQGPRFYRFPEGTVRMTWEAYDFDECSPNSVTLYSDSPNRGITWSAPQVCMADIAGGVFSGPALRLRGSMTALMLLARTRHAIVVDEKRRVATAGSDYFQASTRIVLRRSADGGRTFDPGSEIPYREITGGKSLPGVGFYGAVDDLLQLQSGRVLAAFMYLDPERSDPARGLQHYTVACLLSDDEGRTWQRGGEITARTPRGAMEVQIAETAPDSLFCLFRTKGGYLYQTASLDGGRTWIPSAPSPLPSPESMARMIRLASGSLLVVWNNVSSVTQQPRHPLAAVLSRDGGRTWGQPKMIADETGLHQLSNHGLIQLDNGCILLGISHYRHVRPMTSDLDVALFDEAWLLEGHDPLRPEPGQEREDKR